MGDGRVALILDVLGIAQLSGVLNAAQDARRSQTERRRAGRRRGRQNYLVFRAGAFDRLAVPLSLVARLEEFPREPRSSTRAGGRSCSTAARSCSLVQLSALLDGSRVDSERHAGSGAGRGLQRRRPRLGLVVDQIVDIVDEAVTVRQTTERAGTRRGRRSSARR